MIAARALDCKRAPAVFLNRKVLTNVVDDQENRVLDDPSLIESAIKGAERFDLETRSGIRQKRDQLRC